MPKRIDFEDLRLPASYANFLISNHCVLVPTFNDPNDCKALGILSELFADRDVIGIHALDLIWGLGTLHCLSREISARGRWHHERM
jgi:agmatine deiminase